jgi:hypothetical protein
MKKSVLLIAVLSSLAGCSLFNRSAAPVAPALKVSDQAPIRAVDITADNARDMARALNDELDRDIDGEFVQP